MLHSNNQPRRASFSSAINYQNNAILCKVQKYNSQIPELHSLYTTESVCQV
jgi:hypothetical protein